MDEDSDDEDDDDDSIVKFKDDANLDDPDEIEAGPKSGMNFN